jgi:hypothetical protein
VLIESELTQQLTGKQRNNQNEKNGAIPEQNENWPDFSF